MPEKRSRLDRAPRVPGWVPAALLVLFVLLVTSAASDKSATFDEAVHIFSGWRILTAGDFALNHEHPPLMKMIAALPLIPMGLEPPATAVRREVDQWQAAHEFVYHANDGDTVLAAARFPITLVAALMAWVCFRLASRWFGPMAGVATLALIVFEPNLLANAGLVTTDLGMTAMTVFSCGAFAMWLERGDRRWLWGTGVILGLALLTKFTAILIAPCLAAAGALRLFLGGTAGSRGIVRWRDLAAGIALIALVSAGVLNLGYGFDGMFSSLRGLTLESDRFRELAAGSFGGVPLPLPAEYVKGFDHAEAGGQRWWAYLFGEHSQTGWRHYYLAALAVKTPIPLLLIAIVGLIAATVLRDRTRGPAAGPVAAWHALWPVVPVLIFLGAFTFSGNLKNIGLRYILPVYPFLCMLGGLATRLRFPRAALIGLLVVWQAGVAFVMYPDYLAFFNLTVGGPARGREVLLDSNLDWGQDLKGLGKFIRERGIDTIYVDYFGRACLNYYGVRSTPDFEGGWIAVSATHLMGVYDDDKARYRFLQDEDPEAVIGRSLFVYNVPRPVGWRPRGGAAAD